MGILRNRLLIRWLENRLDRLYADASHIVCLSEGMASQVLTHGRWEDKVSVVHNGVDTRQFFLPKSDLKTDFVHGVYTGTVGIANGLDHLIHACQRLKELGEERLRITILGNGNDFGRIKAMADGLNWPFLQFKDSIPKEEMPQFLATADFGIVCFANFKVLEANSANKLFDYLAAGLPVVLNYEGWQAEYIRKVNCGICVPQGNDQGLAEALVEMIELGAENRMKMGLSGRALAEKHFDRNELSQQLLNLFEKVRASYS
jgi:glycosyltransferase involved in cell wall biosynthesis